MGLLDKVKSLAGGNKQKASSAIDQGAGAADSATGGKFSDKIDQGADTAKDQVDKLPDE